MLASAVTAFYQQQDYPFARAFMPSRLDSDVLHIAIVDGRYGAGVGVRVHYDPWHLDGVLAWRIKDGQPSSDTHSERGRYGYRRVHDC